MGLRVWYPMNGTVVNQGAAAINSTVGSGVTSATDGKIGANCMKFSGAAAGRITFPAQLTSTSEFSVAMWIKLTTASTSQALFSSGISSSGTTGINVFAMNTGKIRFDDGASLTGSTVLAADTWYHIVCAHSNTKKYIYINGVLDASATKNTPTAINTNVNAIGIRLSNTAGTSYSVYYSGYMNDFRLYNHCLSAEEARELHNGLILHYKLDGGGFGNPNLITNYDTSFLSYNDGATTLFTNQMNSGTMEITSNILGAKKCLHLNSKGGSNRVYKTLSGTSGKTYTLSLDYYSTSSQTTAMTFQGNGGNYSWTSFGTAKYTKGAWTHLSITSPALTSNTTLYYFMYCANGTHVYIKNIKIEEGDSATAWAPADSQFNIDRTVIRDNSGFGNDGLAVNSPTLDSTPAVRYGQSMLFNGSNQYIRAYRTSMIKDAISVSIWAYKADWSSGAVGRLCGCLQSGGWGFDNDSAGIRFLVGTGASSNTYKNATSSTKYTALAAGWHHFVGTYDGLVVKLYVDGKQHASTTAYTTKTPIYYNTGNGVFVAAEASTSQTSPTTPYFPGQLSDFRIYCSALDATEVEKLYRMGAAIDKQGGLHTEEFVEDYAAEITKQARVRGDIEELTYTSYDENIYTESDGSQWIRIFHHAKPSTKKFASTNTFATQVYIDADRWFNVSVCNNVAQWELMVKQALTSSSTEVKYRWIQQANPMTATYAQIAADLIEQNSDSGYSTHTKGGLYYKNSSTYLAQNTGSATAWWGAMGSWTDYSSGIPGFGTGTSSTAKVTTGYCDLYIRIDNLPASISKNNVWFATQLIER